jgi:hypothetical protein
MKSVPISVRLSPDDAEFLAGLDVEGASTPSDKLRALIVEAKQRRHGTEDYFSALKLAEDLLAPTLRALRTSEHAQGVHSELVSRFAEWLPECVAFLIAAKAGEKAFGREQLTEIERGLADRAFLLTQSVLQMGVTGSSPCYDPAVVSHRLKPVLDLARIIDKQSA